MPAPWFSLPFLRRRGRLCSCDYLIANFIPVCVGGSSSLGDINMIYTASDSSCGIMQPYFLPYIGYFQLINAVENFVIYDNIQYSKGGWINRNRILSNGKPKLVTLPLQSASDYLDIADRHLSVNFDRRSLLRQFDGSYMRSPYYREVRPLLEEIVLCESGNLFEYIKHSIDTLLQYFGISTKVFVSSTLPVDRSLKSESRVIATCQALGADIYVNGIGGMELYSEVEFGKNNLILKFVKSRLSGYPQSCDGFIPALSIIDVMCHCSRSEVIDMINRDFDYVIKESGCSLNVNQ